MARFHQFLTGLLVQSGIVDVHRLRLANVEPESENVRFFQHADSASLMRLILCRALRGVPWQS